MQEKTNMKVSGFYWWGLRSVGFNIATVEPTSPHAQPKNFTN